jgi:hypothetical protein
MGVSHILPYTNTIGDLSIVCLGDKMPLLSDFDASRMAYHGAEAPNKLLLCHLITS